MTAHDNAESHPLLQQLGVHIEPELLTRALTHRSWAYENGEAPHNERLEFLGDSVLGQAVTVRLYSDLPDVGEGTLAKRRAGVVSTVALAEIARGIGLGEYLYLGRGEDRTGGRDKDSILADTMEALIGAAYLSSGGEDTAAMVMRLVQPLLDDPERVGAAVDPKTSLQEIASRMGFSPPTYRVTSTGPDHDRLFTAHVTVGDTEATGSGSSKKHSEMVAALTAWRELNARA